MIIKTQHEQFPLARPFTISRGTRTYQDVVTVTIQQNGLSATAECTPYPRYGESIESVIKQIELLNHNLSGTQLTRANLPDYLTPGAARNAVDCALWRLEHQAAFPYQAFTIKPEIITAMTTSLDTPEAMGKQAKELCDEKGAKLLKVKLNHELIIERVKAVRENAPKADIILDANEAWGELTPDTDLSTLFEQLASFNITMIEQPVPKGMDNMLLGINHPIDLCADESCHTSEDLDKLVGCYEMINIKLDKTGGLTEALALEAKARSMGFKIMVGCMVGSSMAMEAALPIATHADIVDLDGPVLLKHDRANGLRYQAGMLHLNH
ncbi:N-acetyl-D-Glu racemase DgcA [Photobacterium sp. OFAV2-7]|uniref:N-acetyl-D-Glu racemase DgcA n=1 Tax=Photobacterium sp. OFAV2-7 TaxID=2917748 RepID=UPI001EF5ED2E|nr:N-acetyl-D-Glu racemase DgcA [Photobacterium sp. OFAV2-7]MCG7587109.1 dipeptide epimerase [Photobacterium sp. OFAV2-7]